MSILLEDSDLVIWRVSITTDGLLTTTVSSGTPTTLFLNSFSDSWQIGVDTSGLLTTTEVPVLVYPTYALLTDSSGRQWTLTVGNNGLLNTSFVFAWVQNGFGAGTDNSIVGGGGGFMAYPQPIVTNGPISFVYNSSTPSGQGNIFIINNPGRP